MNDFLDHIGNPPTTAAPSKAAAPPTTLITQLRAAWAELFPTIDFDQIVTELEAFVSHEHWDHVWELALELLGCVPPNKRTEHPEGWRVVAHAHREEWVQGGGPAM